MWYILIYSLIYSIFQWVCLDLFASVLLVFLVNSLFDFTFIWFYVDLPISFLFWWILKYFLLLSFWAILFSLNYFETPLLPSPPHPFSPNTHTHTELNSDSNHSCVEVGSLLLQDAIDLFLGNHIVEETEGLATRSPLAVQRDWKFYAVSTLTDLGPCVLIMYSLHDSETPLIQIS